MKDFRGMKRQRSRNRKPSGQSGNPNRAYESNGPEGAKVRGNAQVVYEKYQQLARDANSSGDRVLAENHLQHAEHYFRVIRQTQPQRPVAEYVQRDPFNNSYDDYDEDGDQEALEGQDASPEGVENIYESNGYEAQDGHNDRGDRQNRDRNNRNRERFDRANRPREPQAYVAPNGVSNDTANTNGHPQINALPQPPSQIMGFETNEADGEGGRRETRRERYERRRQQRLLEQETVQTMSDPSLATLTPPSLTSPSLKSPSLTSYEPSFGGHVATPMPVAFIASTEPLAVPVKQVQAAADLSHLPAFLRAPTSLYAEITASLETEVAPEVAPEAAPEAAPDSTPVARKRGRPPRPKPVDQVEA
jgi:Domain of unknown function (DUF4167)